MTDSFEEIRQRALALSPEERLQRRLAQVENGTAKLVPAEEVFAKARRILLGRKRDIR